MWWEMARRWMKEELSREMQFQLILLCAHLPQENKMLQRDVKGISLQKIILCLGKRVWFITMAFFRWGVPGLCCYITLIGVKQIQQERCSEEGRTSHGGAFYLPLTQYGGEMWSWSRERDWSRLMPRWSMILCTHRRSAPIRKKPILTASYECSSTEVKVVQKRLTKNMKGFCQGGIKILFASDTAFRCQLKIKIGTSKWEMVILRF